MIEEKKTYPHKLVVNEYMKIDLQIPEVLDASELEGLMRMVSKIVNVNRIPTTQPEMKSRNASVWTDDQLKAARKLWQSDKSKDWNFRHIGEELDISRGTVQGKYYNELAKGNDWSVKRK